MVQKLLQIWCAVLLRAPRAVLAAVLIVAAVGTWLGTRLTINTNQLDQLDPDIRAVEDAERIIDMSGGAGMLTLALRGNDPELLKKVGDEVAARLGQDTDRIRTATAKLPIEFFKAHAAMYLETEDLAEVKRRTMLWLKDAQKRASPFFFEIKKTEPVKLDLSDMPEDLAVLSARASSLELLDKVRLECGDAYDDWKEAFRKGATQ